MKQAELIDWGLLDYEEALVRQRERVEERKKDEVDDAIVVVEHPHVITLGRRKDSPKNVLAASGVPVVEIERGGDVTYHGPGQIVIYPIVKLEGPEQDLHAFLRNMEEGIIEMLRDYDIDAGREEGKTGVWVEGRKLASMGIACRRWVTFHGLALNVTTDLSYFQRINPCGFSSAVMTSVARERPGHPVDLERAKMRLATCVANKLGRTLS